MVDGILMELIDQRVGWRYMLGLAAIPSIIMLIGFTFYLPESPRWLAITNDTDTALSVLKSVRDTDKDAIDELNDILRSIGKLHLVINTEQHQSNTTSVEEVNGIPVEYGTTSTTLNTSNGNSNHILSIDNDNNSSGNIITRLKQLLADRPARRALYLGCGLMLIQQFSGVNTYVFKTYNIFSMLLLETCPLTIKFLVFI
jgi:MFS family permease